MEVAVKVGALMLSKLRSGWTVGVVSVDAEPWAGQRVLHREKLNEADPQPRLQELKRHVESGTLPIPQPIDWRFRRKVPGI
jgi:hypothetical protein